MPEWARGSQLRAQLVAQVRGGRSGWLLVYLFFVLFQAVASASVAKEAGLHAHHRVPASLSAVAHAALLCRRLTPPQTYVDPDEIFQQHQKTCSLDEVFANGACRCWLLPGSRQHAHVPATARAPPTPVLPPRPPRPRAGKSKQDLSRRTSSGNWIEDRVTWKEEMSYKRAMGFL